MPRFGSIVISPHVFGAAGVLVGVLRPRVVAELPRVRNRVKTPHLLAGDDVVGAQVARRGEIVLRRWPSKQIRFSKIFPGVPDCARPTVAGSRPSPSRRLTAPSTPKDRIDLPVLASIASR